MSIRVNPVTPAAKSGYHRSRMTVHIPEDPRYKVKRDNPQFRQLLDEVQQKLQKR